MSYSLFVKRRRERWSRLEALVTRASRRGTDRLTVDELFELGSLYRTVASDLSVARRDYPQETITTSLNTLLARAHPLIYREPAARRSGLWPFIRYGYPAAYRDAGGYIALAFGIFAVSAIICYLLVAIRPATADILLPGTAQSLRDVLQHHHLWVQSATENHSVAESFITLNNIKVAFLAFAGGMLVGVGTFAVLALNGLNLGAVLALTAQYGLSLQLVAFMLPHGVIELSTIFIAGGAGLMIGDAILHPGLRRRSVVLAEAARRAAVLLGGCIPLLIVAGALESFFSPSNAPLAAKVAVGLVSGLILYGYLLLSRPRPTAVRAPLFPDID